MILEQRNNKELELEDRMLPRQIVYLSSLMYNTSCNCFNKTVDFQIDASSLPFEWLKPVASSAIKSVSIRSRFQLEAKFLKAIAIYPIDDGIPQIMQATIGL